MTESTAIPTGQGDAVLVLEDGRTFRGRAYGATGMTLGEVVFTTAMSGYQETVTDPGHYGQIVVLTSPHIGNTGVNKADNASERIWLRGLVVRDPSRISSNWRSEGEFTDSLTGGKIIGISGIDTRALTRHLRDNRAQRGGIFSGPALLRDGYARPLDDLVAEVRSASSGMGENLSSKVTTAEPYVLEPSAGDAESGGASGTSETSGTAGTGETATKAVVVIDLGTDAATLRRLTDRGLRVHVLPATATLDQVQGLNPDGVVISSGPGDPAACAPQIELLRGILDARIPVFGIGLGHALLGRALGFDTEKLPFGHHGVNQPVKDLRSGKVEITAHSHGFAVLAPTDGQAVAAPHNSGQFGRVLAPHICLTDGSVEALECLDRPAMSVQYHPEPGAGPRDTAYLFDRFAELLVPGTESAAGLTTLNPTARTAAKEN